MTSLTSVSTAMASPPRYEDNERDDRVAARPPLEDADDIHEDEAERNGDEPYDEALVVAEFPYPEEATNDEAEDERARDDGRHETALGNNPLFRHEEGTDERDGRAENARRLPVSLEDVLQAPETEREHEQPYRETEEAYLDEFVTQYAHGHELPNQLYGEVERVIHAERERVRYEEQGKEG